MRYVVGMGLPIALILVFLVFGCSLVDPYRGFYGTWQGQSASLIHVVRINPNRTLIHSYINPNVSGIRGEYYRDRRQWAPDDERPQIKIRYISEQGRWGYITRFGDDSLEFTECSCDGRIEKVLLRRTSHSYADPQSQ